MQKGIASNIWKMYVIQAIHWFLLIIPILVLFYKENGLSMTEVFILQAIYSISVVAFEIPSGYFSDILGRKQSMIVGSILWAIGCSFYIISFDFWGFLAAELILGFGSSFISGTDSAIIYDTLLEMGKEKSYKKYEGKFLSIGNFSEGFASILGGILAVASLRTPFYYQALIALFAIPLASTLIEPKRHRMDTSEGNMKNILKIVKYSLHGHPEIKWLILYSSILVSSTLTMVWFIQPYLKLVGLPLFLFGVVWASLQFSVGIFHLSAHSVEKHLGRKKTLMSLIVLTVLGYLLLAYFQSLWAIVFIFIFYYIRGIHTPTIKYYINKLISSDKRATVLSVKSMMGRLTFAIIGPFLGWVHDLYSLSFAFIIASLLYGLCGIISLGYLSKHKALET